MADSPDMKDAAKHPGAVWFKGRRALLGLGGVALFVGVASVIKPSPRGASAGIEGLNEPAIAVHRANATRAEHPRGWKLIGIVEGREHVLRCWATRDGARYSVHALDGRLVQDDLPADEVYRGFPDLDLPNLRADPPGEGGMLVDFVDVWRE